MWEYKGNEDGAIHGPFTTKQMLEWTSCGYFVGANAVDIRRVGSGNAGDAGVKSDVDDLMADLMEDEEESEKKADGSNEWMRSDAVDFNSYL
jgi:CD2 antigen cytoplasmic tail-binding protein 2